jgi:LysR family cys regulon transcriptional activator
VFKPTHPLAERYAAAGALTLADLAEFPIVTYDLGFSGRRNIDEAFSAAGLRPEVVLAAIDADVIKTYVGVGLGIGIIAAMAYDDKQDNELVCAPVGHLFGEQTARVAVRQGEFLRDYVYTFIAMLAQELKPEEIRALMRPNI